MSPQQWQRLGQPRSAAIGRGVGPPEVGLSQEEPCVSPPRPCEDAGPRVQASDGQCRRGRNRGPVQGLSVRGGLAPGGCVSVPGGGPRARGQRTVSPRTVSPRTWGLGGRVPFPSPLLGMRWGLLGQSCQKWPPLAPLQGPARPAGSLREQGRVLSARGRRHQPHLTPGLEGPQEGLLEGSL